MRRLRAWSVRNALVLDRFYRLIEEGLIRLHPLFAVIGYQRLERPVAWLEALVKGLLFDCRMCGQCVLSRTGMSCPMNCPKGLRNGPCGGVREGGRCEVEPAMACVWIAAQDGANAIGAPLFGAEPNPPLDHRLIGQSSWLRIARGDAPRAKS
ncbi:MAG: hypothetical protein FJX47_21035 [Alphaproteobacteria bacterium]|nr:hypothetical protein [Alphaproteobacteria bacterium]